MFANQPSKHLSKTTVPAVVPFLQPYPDYAFGQYTHKPLDKIDPSKQPFALVADVQPVLLAGQATQAPDAKTNPFEQFNATVADEQFVTFYGHLRQEPDVVKYVPTLQFNAKVAFVQLVAPVPQA